MNVLTKITTKRWLLPEFANNANRCWSKSSSSSNNNNSSSNRSNSSSKQDDLVKCEFVSGGRVAVVSLNDPPRMNALTEAMGDALEARVRELAQVRGLRAAVLTGEGRAFSAGGDLDFLLRESGRSRESNRETMQAFYRRFLSLRRSPVPWVAAVNGHAIGAGLCLAVGGCDVRVAHRDARMGMTFVRLGLHPGMAATHFLPQVVGPAAAAELMLTGRTITAEEALGMGLVSKVSNCMQRCALPFDSENRPGRSPTPLCRTLWPWLRRSARPPPSPSGTAWRPSGARRRSHGASR